MHTTQAAHGTTDDTARDYRACVELDLWLVHRAIVSSLCHRTEMVVFFEWSIHKPGASSHIEALLTAAWGVDADDLDIYNVTPALDVARENWTDDRPVPHKGAFLFAVSGGSAGPGFVEQHRTQFFVSPRNLKKLQTIQAAVEAKSCPTCSGAGKFRLPRKRLWQACTDCLCKHEQQALLAGAQQ